MQLRDQVQMSHDREHIKLVNILLRNYTDSYRYNSYKIVSMQSTIKPGGDERTAISIHAAIWNVYVDCIPTNQLYYTTNLSMTSKLIEVQGSIELTSLQHTLYRIVSKIMFLWLTNTCTYMHAQRGIKAYVIVDMRVDHVWYHVWFPFHFLGYAFYSIGIAS